MLFKSDLEMTQYMEAKYFGDRSNHDVVYAYLTEAIVEMGTIAANALEDWLKEMGFSREQYVVDDKAYFSKMEENTKLCLEKFMMNNKLSMAHAFTCANYKAPIKDNYEKDSWLMDYSEEGLAQKAIASVKSYCVRNKREIEAELRSACDRELRNSPPKLYSKDYLAAQEAKKEKIVVSSYLNARTDGKPYKMVSDPYPTCYIEAAKWLAETDSKVLYEAVLFSNNHINHGFGLFALQNIAKNPYTPPDALWMIAKGELDNQGESMMTNADVKATWLSVLENPNCPLSLILDIALEATLASDILPMERAAYISAAHTAYVNGNSHTEQLSQLFGDYMNQKTDISELSQFLAEILVDRGIRIDAQKELLEHTDADDKELTDREELPGHVIE